MLTPVAQTLQLIWTDGFEATDRIERCFRIPSCISTFDDTFRPFLFPYNPLESGMSSHFDLILLFCIIREEQRTDWRLRKVYIIENYMCNTSCLTKKSKLVDRTYKTHKLISIV